MGGMSEVATIEPGVHVWVDGFVYAQPFEWGLPGDAIIVPKPFTRQAVVLDVVGLAALVEYVDDETREAVAVARLSVAINVLD